MSYLFSLMKLIATCNNEDPRKEALVRKIDMLEGENTLLKAQYEEHERENTRLQIELFNVETMMEPINQFPGAESIENTNMQLMETCININHSISQIEFSKIVQFNYIEIEQSYREEMQQLKDRTVILLEWHEIMEKRYVVQSYRKVEKSYKEMLKNNEKNASDMEKSTKQNLSWLREAEEALNSLVLYTVEESRISNKIKDKIEQASVLTDLQKQRVELLEILESKQQKIFSSMLAYNNTFKPSISSGAGNTFQYEMPKFSSINDILKTFDQDLSQIELEPQIKVIENTTNIMVKSILCNNIQNNSMEINQPITPKHTKHVHFRMPLEDKFEFQETTDNTLSDCSSEDSVVPMIEVPHPSRVKDTKMENQIETIDIIAPSDGEIPVNKHQGPTNPTSQPKDHILECIVINPPTTNKGTSNGKCAEKDKENVPTKSFNVVELQNNSLQINQSITPEHTKHMNFKMQLEDKVEFQETTGNTLWDCSSQDSVETVIEVPDMPGVKDTKMENQIEPIDLSAQKYFDIPAYKNQGPTNPSSKPKVEILECIVIKSPTSNKGNSNDTCVEKDKENVQTKSFNVVELQENELNVKTSRNNEIYSQNPGPSRKERHSLKKNFYDEFLNAISSDDSSDLTEDFELLFCEQSQAPDFVQSQDKFKPGPEEVVENNNDAVEEGAVANLNFDRRQDFFDLSDDGDGVDAFAKDSKMDFFS